MKVPLTPEALALFTKTFLIISWCWRRKSWQTMAKWEQSGRVGESYTKSHKENYLNLNIRPSRWKRGSKGRHLGAAFPEGIKSDMQKQIQQIWVKNIKHVIIKIHCRSVICTESLTCWLAFPSLLENLILRLRKPTKFAFEMIKGKIGLATG